jgi:hypothetical protein
MTIRGVATRRPCTILDGMYHTGCVQMCANGIDCTDPVARILCCSGVGRSLQAGVDSKWHAILCVFGAAASCCLPSFGVVLTS